MKSFSWTNWQLNYQKYHLGYKKTPAIRPIVVSLFLSCKTFILFITQILIMNISENTYTNFLSDIKDRIRKSQYEAAKVVNTEMIRLYWDIGRRILEKQKDGWGKSVVENLSKDIQMEFPGIKGFSTSNLWYMKQFYEEYHDNEILQPLVGEISWAKHLVIMSKCKQLEERQFYILTTKKMGWTKDVLPIGVLLKILQQHFPKSTNHNYQIQKKWQKN